MQYVYIAGLEHSGTTLLAHLLGQSEDVVSLGEVGQFFSPPHMRRYIARWGEYPDARLCSCGVDWEKCNFWGPLYNLSGINNDSPIDAKYGTLLDYLGRESPNQTYVDSSKNLDHLKALTAQAGDEKLFNSELYILLAVKDVRGFASSIIAKNRSTSMIDVIRTFNWWAGVNTRIQEYLRGKEINFRTILYENLCFDTNKVLSAIYRDIGVSGNRSIDPRHNRSHIVMGNKDFISRNRDRVKYDFRWFLNNRINLAYLCHGTARRLNKSLYEETS